MRILWISHLLPYPPVGGVRIRSYNLLKELCKYSEIYLVALFQRAHQKSENEVKDGVDALRAFCKRIEVYPLESWNNRADWYSLAVKGFFSLEPHKVKWARSKGLSHEIDQLLNSISFDIIHFDTISLLQYANTLVNDMVTVINHHNIESQMMYRRAVNSKNLFIKLYCRWEAYKLKKMEIKYCAHNLNLVVSELDRQRLLEHLPHSAVEVIPNGVDLQYMKKMDVPHREKSLIFVGGLKWYPNIDAIMYFCQEIWPGVIKKEPRAVFYVVGRNPPERLLRIANKSKNVVLTGFLPDVRPLMSSASAYVCPMRLGGGTRLKVLDALSMGLPLITTKMACEGIPVENAKHVLFAERPHEFIDAIIKVFNSEGLRKDLGFNARKLIEEYFDFEKIGFKLFNCYESYRNQ